jgi:hypothetical protein
MSDGELTVPDQHDCTEVLYEYRDVIEGAYLELLSGIYTQDCDRRITTVIGLGGVLNADHTLCADLRLTIDAVLAGRDVSTITIDDFKKIASRSPDWLRTQGLSASWRNAAYDARSRCPVVVGSTEAIYPPP